MSGLFGTLNISTRGLFAQQRAINTTSHNIANANTEGYSRQRVTMQTSRPQSLPNGTGQIGTGVDVSAVNRIRDNFLDYQVRVENGVSGQFIGRDKFLSEIENIFNEPTDTGMSTLIGKFFDSWHTLGTSAKESNARSIVAQQSLALTNELNHTYTELESLKTNTQTVIKDTVFNVNAMLGQLNQLNQQIKQVTISGNIPNDLMDRRDLILDQLSGKFGLDLKKTQFDGVDVTTSNESKYADATDNGNAPQLNGKPLNIIQSINPETTARFSYVSSIKLDSTAATTADGKNTYEVTYYKNADMTDDKNAVKIKVTMTDSEYKQLDQCRILWSNNNGVALKVKDGNKVDTDLADGNNLDGKSSNVYNFGDLALFKAPTGELKGYMSVQKDIETYEGKLNSFAKALAFGINGIMSQSDTPAADVKDSEGKIISANSFFVNGSKASAYTTDSASVEKAEQEITAGNITVNQAIMNNAMLIKTAVKYDENGKNLSGESDGARALAVETLRDRLMSIQGVKDSTKRKEFLTSDIFKQDSSNNNLYTVTNDIGGMTLDSYFKDTVNRLGIQEQEARRMVGNQEKLLASFKESRDSVSGVSLDEEMANLVQFQHCYQANAKIISTVDQLLEVVINGLKR